MQITGNLRKMSTELEDGNAHYWQIIRDVLEPLDTIDFNQLVGKEISLEYEGYINSILSGEKIKKSFGEGLTYKEFMESPQASPSIFQPELSRIHEGVALRDYAWEVKHHLQPHKVYISLTGGFKVGVTRNTNLPYRWIDQGAIQAVVIAEVPYRQMAGLIEVSLKPHISDKTSWQKMLKGEFNSEKQIRDIVSEMIELIPEEFQAYTIRDSEVFNISYPIQNQPSKIKSIKLDKEKRIEKKLVGIKGQYLIFDDGCVLNVRSHSGYRVTLST